MTVTESKNNRTILPRYLPAPLPAIHPTPERDAFGSLKRVYSETKEVLQVPWMGVVTMALAHYPTFYDTLWQSFRPLYESRQFTDACRQLRDQVESNIDALGPRSLVNELLAAGYSHQELNDIRELLEVFSEGNMPYLIIASQARVLMEGLPLSNVQEVTPSQKAPEEKAAKLILMEEHHANEQLRELYREIKTTLGLPFVNTDYRALARWPHYLERAWQDLSPNIRSQSYRTITNDLHATALNVVVELPNPKLVDPLALSSAATKDSTHEEVLEVIRLFQYLLPGLVANIAYFRAQLKPL